MILNLLICLVDVNINDPPHSNMRTTNIHGQFSCTNKCAIYQ